MWKSERFVAAFRGATDASVLRLKSARSPTRFDQTVWKSRTHTLEIKQKIGRGYFSTVYSAVLDHRIAVAAKVTPISVHSRVEGALYRLASDHGIGPRVPTPFLFEIKDGSNFHDFLHGDPDDSGTESNEGLLVILMEKYDYDWAAFRKVIKQSSADSKTKRRLNAHIRKRVIEKTRLLHSLGIRCIDQSSRNVLIKFENGGWKVALTDFDAAFCCYHTEGGKIHAPGVRACDAFDLAQPTGLSHPAEPFND